MSFFNTKEEVLDIELTPYGKFLLSKGEWKPAFYEFYDDDVLYDSEYAGYVEKQEEAQQRIKQTVRPRTQYSFEGAETRYKEYRKQINNSENSSIAALEKRRSLSVNCLPLGNSSVSEEAPPSWQVKILNGEIQYVTSSLSIVGLPNTSNIIQLKDIEYKTYVTKEEFLTEETNYNSRLDSTNTRYEDGTYIAIEEEYLLLDISETGLDLSNEYFDIEIFLIENGENGEFELPLEFIKQKEQVVDGVYVEETEEEFPLLGNFPIENSESRFADSYFDIHVDKEIDTKILCKHLAESELEKLRVKEGYIINCKEEGMVIRDKPIKTRVTQEDLDRFEDC